MRVPPQAFIRSLRSVRYSSSKSTRPPIVCIDNGTFYRRQPSSATTSEDSNPSLFPKLSYSIPYENESKHYWAIVGPSNAGKTTFLEILRGQHQCHPPTARTYPYLSTPKLEKKDPRLRFPGNAIQYVGFDGKQRGLSGMGTYMSARYESRREATDFSVLDYLKGRTQLNEAEDQREKVQEDALERVIEDLRLRNLVDMPVSNLSNGQTRRAKIAKALLGRPEVLLLDEPFMGLDPSTTIQLSSLLHSMAAANNPRLLLTLRPQDPIPEWITHVMFLGENQRITHRGTKVEVGEALLPSAAPVEEPGKEASSIPRSYAEFGRTLTDTGIQADVDLLLPEERERYLELKREYDQGGRSLRLKGLLAKYTDPLPHYAAGHPGFDPAEPPVGEPLIEIDGAVVSYGNKTVLGAGHQIDSGVRRDTPGLHWHVHRGQRWLIAGPNGSGKTTLLSLLTSDHPQSYSLPIKLFGRTRLPSHGQPGIPLFELQRRIGHSSPEVHSFFPRHLTVRATLESAFAPTPLSKPTLDASADDRISSFLRWFQDQLHPTLGMHPTLLEEYFRTADTVRRKEHSVASHPELWRERYNKYWYEHATSLEESVEWADTLPFSDLSSSAQRVLLFLRAIVSKPDIIILDEAFSGLDDYVRDKCMLFLEVGEKQRLTPWKRKIKSWSTEDRSQFNEGGWQGIDRGQKDLKDALFWGVEDWQVLVCVSHVREEVPRVVRDWVYLPDVAGGGGSVAAGGEGAGAGETEVTGVIRTGRVEGVALRRNPPAWARIWEGDLKRKTKAKRTSEEVQAEKRMKAERWQAELERRRVRKEEKERVKAEREREMEGEKEKESQSTGPKRRPKKNG